MDRDEGMRVLSGRGWLSATPVDFQRAILSRCLWKHLEAGHRITVGGEQAGDLIGLAHGTIELTTVLGVSETPMMHLGYPVYWLGYGPIMSGQPRRISANAKSAVWLASVPRTTVMGLLGERPEWWQHFLPLALEYGDVAINIAADMLIRGSDRRCAAALLRLSGRRFPDQDGTAPVEILLSQDELAAAANLSRNTTGDVLRKLVEGGLIELSYRCIIVRSPAALLAFVEQNHR
jgi:CRP-like cAMP-binding protein